MHEYCDLLLDKADSPWFSDEEKDRFLNLAQPQFAESRYREFELDERTRSELIPLVRQSTGSNTSSINLDAIQEYMFTLALMGEFNKSCGNGTTWEKISPVQLDDVAENQHDPFNKNDDTNPGYTEGNDGTNNVISIISDNDPLNYTLKYLKRPTNVRLDRNNPSNNVNCELPEFTHEEIVRIAVSKMMATTEQQLNYQLNQNEMNNQN